MSRLALRWPDAATLVQALEPLQALAVAVIGEDGHVRDANRGFRRLVDGDGQPHARDAASFFVLPTFDALRDAEALGPEGTVYRGRITLGHVSGDASSLRGEVRRREGAYLLVAEHETKELQAMAASMIELTEQMAQTQRDLVRAKKDLEARERELAEMAVTDPLTGLANRRALDRRLEEELVRSERTGAPLSAVMVDLDHFKTFNDTNGHQVGDSCLKAVSRIMLEHTRPYDVVARYGGEEFLLVLPGMTVDVARARAEDIRAAIARTDVPGTEDRITASFGVAQSTGHTADTLLRAADDALYDAKRAGRNRVCAAGA